MKIKSFAIALIILIGFGFDLPERTNHPMPEKHFKVGEDKRASFPGGKEALAEWLKENMDYPEDLKRFGTVVVDFIVKKNGKCTDFKVHKGVNEDLDILAVEILRGMPKWEPAMKDGKAVDSKVQLPVKFVPKSEKGNLGG